MCRQKDVNALRVAQATLPSGQVAIPDVGVFQLKHAQGKLLKGSFCVNDKLAEEAPPVGSGPRNHCSRVLNTTVAKDWA
jgi:hypothetical protein